MGNSFLILLGQNIALQILMFSISTNILMILANFLSVIIEFFHKTLVSTVATLHQVDYQPRKSLFY